VKTILIVEDNFEIRESLSEILILSDYRVITAENGKEGLHLARTHLPDAIISDLMMPEMDGTDLLRQLRAHPATSTIPFLFVTGSSDVSEKRDALALGANGYIRKPFTAEELLMGVSKALGLAL
jgi:CheY-like chemotaxis protein